MKFHKTLIAAAAIAAGVFTAIPDTAAGDNRALELLKLDRPIVVGHRGFSMGAPENTIPSYQWAKLACADMVELDFYINKEGTLFCMHDGTLDRTSNIREALGLTNAPMSSLTDEQVRKLDAGKWKSPLYTKVPIPSFEEALAAIQDQGGITLAEHKTGSAEQCAEILKKHDYVNELIVQSFNWSFLADMQKVLPEQVTIALGPTNTRDGVKVGNQEKALDSKWIDSMLKLGVKGAAWNANVTKEGIDYAHHKGLKVFIYTVNDIAKAQFLLDMGVDGIITDNPALVWKAIATRK